MAKEEVTRAQRNGGRFSFLTYDSGASNTLFGVVGGRDRVCEMGEGVV